MSMERYELFFNADVGEAAGFDDQIIPLVRGVNISCGAHAGSEENLKQAITIAMNGNKVIGAHPGYPDRENYGRKEVNLSKGELRSTLWEQLEYLDCLVKGAGGVVQYIKPHGALYNKMSRDYDFSLEVLEIFQEWRKLPIMVLAKSEALRAATEIGVSAFREGFLDRAYTDEGLLVSRAEPNAVISDVDTAKRQTRAFIENRPIQTVSGRELQIEVDSICVHGDTADALSFLKAVLY